MPPKVSICVPNLNTRPYLAERFQTIFDQTLTDWELLVYDSFSNDGAWEYIGELAAKTPRMRAWQGPREGAPGSWTPCIREARGEYVYIATSDDTMPPACLEKLAAALDAHPECDIAHCRLRIIDEQGRDAEDWWTEGSLFAKSSGRLLDRPHVRRAPYDGLLHLVGETVYISITQLLIRRSLFDRIGMFESTWGSISDFNWDMRAGLVANTVHVPDTWGGWRVHPSQATAGAAIGSPQHGGRIDAMIEQALAACRSALPTVVERRLTPRWLAEVKDYRTFERETASWHERSVRHLTFIGRRVLTGSAAARTHVMARLGAGSRPWRETFPEELLAWLEDSGLGTVLQPLPDRGALAQ
jgi:glycosyl transferase family 2